MENKSILGPYPSNSVTHGLLQGSLSSCHWCSLAKQFFAVHPDCENSPPKIVSWKRTVASHPLYFPLHPIVSNVLLSVCIYWQLQYYLYVYIYIIYTQRITDDNRSTCWCEENFSTATSTPKWWKWCNKFSHFSSKAEVDQKMTFVVAEFVRQQLFSWKTGTNVRCLRSKISGPFGQCANTALHDWKA